MPKRTKPAPQKFSGVHIPPFPGPKKPTLPLPRLTLRYRPAGFCLVTKPHERTGIPTDQMMRLRPSEARRLGQKLDTPLGVWNRPDPNSTHIEPSACHPRMHVDGFAGQPGHTASSPAGRAQDSPVPRLTHPCSSADSPARRMHVPAARLLMRR